MEEADHRRDNPFTTLEGYTVFDASGSQVGRVEDTVYDAVSDVLKYVVVRGHPVPADDVEVDVEAERIIVPYDKESVESAPQMQDPSGAFDDAVRGHYGMDG
jgi:sporulation protein YlmC with PRC-barrel domain